MTDYLLEITLLSPLTSAAGEGRVGFVDRDVAFDDLGLPIIPGRRLKGLWREAYRDIFDAWRQCGESPVPEELIFGEPGRERGVGAGSFHVGNAAIIQSSELKPWLKYLQHPGVRKLHFDEVLTHFANVRAQTAIDRHTGAALENTLRLTRTLKAGLKFRAGVRFAEPPRDELTNALALGAAALRHMGTARTRGLGRVRCRLIARDGDGRELDLTGRILSCNGGKLPTAVHSSDPPSTAGNAATQSLSPAGTGGKIGVPTHFLRYRLTLRGPIVIPVAEGDPNMVMTRQDIPGSHMLGAAAWQYLRQSGNSPAKRQFRRAFLDGGLRFLTAYPEAGGLESVDGPPRRMIPVPHSIRRFKDEEGITDFAETPPDDRSRPRATRRVDSRYANLGDGSFETQAVKTELNFHHARAGDRRKGRATKVSGAVFVYEAIQPGQPFQGAVLGTKCLLNDLLEWMKGVSSIAIGRSRGAQYGEAAFEWIDHDGPHCLQGLSEWDGFLVNRPAGLTNKEKKLFITTLSPMLTVNDHGHPEARFPLADLAQVLKVDSCGLQLSRCYTRTELVGGYQTHLRLPRQQWPAIAAGSVFVLRMESVSDDLQTRLDELERDGLGLRRGEGYGRVAVNRQGSLQLFEETQLDDPEKGTRMPDPPQSKLPASARELLMGIVRTRCMIEVQRDAMTVARATRNIPSNALLGRLRRTLQQNPPGGKTSWLSTLRKPAKDGLLGCRIDTRNVTLSWMEKPPRSLYGLFERVWGEPGAVTASLIETHVKDIVGVDALGEETCEEMTKILKCSESSALCGAFLGYLLTALHCKARAYHDSSPGEEGQFGRRAR